MDVAVTGSHGLIGTALVAALREAGHTVRPVVRGTAGAGEVAWDPAAGTIDVAGLQGIDAAVHLGAVGIGDHRWTDAHKDAVRSSRVLGTSLLAGALGALDRPPAVLVCGSAVGYYGDRGDEVLTEDSGPGTGFLADVVQAWEAAAAPAAEAGIRVVLARSGVVQTPAGGALRKQLPFFRLGLGGPLGTGHQWVSWVTLEDEVAAILHALAADDLSGPVNVVAPEPVTSADLARAVGRALHRPALLPAPTPALKLVLGAQMTGEMVTASQRAVPARLEGSGFRFRHPEIGAAMSALLDGR
ncbi:MAG TPA: TIGR01777 family oxidoreductase [Acidimicrobiales bacterium]|nr:TIGR01777 family oxidoreductase [Acidimicrobiales bacterium]